MVAEGRCNNILIISYFDFCRVRMVHLREEFDDGRLVRVPLGKLEVQHERTILPRGVVWPKDDGLPLHDVVIERRAALMPSGGSDCMRLKSPMRRLRAAVDMQRVREGNSEKTARPRKTRIPILLYECTQSHSHSHIHVNSMAASAFHSLFRKYTCTQKKHSCFASTRLTQRTDRAARRAAHLYYMLCHTA
jgi:hypothetical protein